MDDGGQQPEDQESNVRGDEATGVTLPAFRRERLDERLGRAICRAEGFVHQYRFPTRPEFRLGIAKECLLHLSKVAMKSWDDIIVVIDLLKEIGNDDDLRNVVQGRRQAPTISKFHGKEIAIAIQAIMEEAKGMRPYLRALTTMAMVHAWKSCQEASLWPRSLHDAYIEVRP